MKYLEKVVIGDCTLYHADCMDIMPFLDKVDAVVTDPPYGIGEAAGKNVKRIGGLAKAKDYGNDEWDNEPCSKEKIEMIRKISKTQIIFGGNYFELPPTKCWLIWDKENGNNDFADAEMAWTNLDKAVRLIRFMWNGMLRKNNEPRGDHPTQKPVEVMRWCIGHLPATQRIILDPFMGSGTTGVSAVKMGKWFIGIEREKKYFDIACQRIRDAYSQPDMLLDAGL